MDKSKVDIFFQSSKDSLSGVAGMIEVMNELNLGYVEEDRHAQVCMLSGLQLLVNQIRTDICEFEQILKKEAEL